MILIKATPDCVRMASQAVAIQDACNPYPVREALGEALVFFGHQGTTASIRNPVSIALLNKLNHLAGLEQSRTECFTACAELAAGRDVEWDI